MKNYVIGVLALAISTVGTIGSADTSDNEGQFSDPSFALVFAEPMYEAKLLGEYLQAWLTCYRDFQNIEDLSDEQKSLEHYHITFHTGERYLIVSFLGKFLDADERRRLNSMIFGRETRYWLDKDTLQIAKRSFYE